MIVPTGSMRLRALRDNRLARACNSGVLSGSGCALRPASTMGLRLKRTNVFSGRTNFESVEGFALMGTELTPKIPVADIKQIFIGLLQYSSLA